MYRVNPIFKMSVTRTFPSFKTDNCPTFFYICSKNKVRQKVIYGYFTVFHIYLSISYKYLSLTYQSPANVITYFSNISVKCSDIIIQ